MREIKFLLHTADVRMKLTASSLEELFEGALEGMNKILKDEVCSQPENMKLKKELKLKSHDTTSLLIDFMNEVLTFTHTCKAIFCHIDIHHLSEREIDATLWGVEIVKLDDDVKAVTYHEADVHVNESGQLETIIILDI